MSVTRDDASVLIEPQTDPRFLFFRTYNPVNFAYGFCKNFRRALCLSRAVVHVLIAVVRVTVIFPWCNEDERRRQVARWSTTALRIFGLHLATNAGPASVVGARLLVVNHVSWLDVFAIWSQTETMFVAKSEVGRWPVIGALARKLGVVFIDRARRGDALATGREIFTFLKMGRSVCIFPEGTSTDGCELQPFHSALFQPAVDAGAKVLPIAIRYFRADGTRATEAAFTGDMSLAQSMWHIAGADPIIIETSHLPLIEATGESRRKLACGAHQLIGRRLRDPARGWDCGVGVAELAFAAVGDDDAI